MKQAYRVFLIEDSKTIQSALVDAFGATGIVDVVGSAETADDAWTALVAWSALVGASVDAIIIDLRLRAGTGFEILAKLQNLPFADKLTMIVLTNFPAPAYRQRSMELGAKFFFDKALEFDRVIEVLENAAAEKAKLADQAPTPN